MKEQCFDRHQPKCKTCDGKGEVAVDHRAWLSGGVMYEEDVFAPCDECDNGIEKPSCYEENENE